jgi:hypothetical protein
MNLQLVVFVVGGFLAVAIAEIVALGGWWSFYFRAGIPVFRREFRAPAPVVVEVARLEQRFTHPGNWLMPAELHFPAGYGWWQRYLNQLETLATPLRFRAFGRSEYGFREQMFTLRLWYFNYLPIMRGQIVVNSNRVTIVGRLNLSVPALVVLIVALFSWTRPGHAGTTTNGWLLLVAGFFVLGLSYTIQARRFRRVGEFLTSRS